MRFLCFGLVACADGDGSGNGDGDIVGTWELFYEQPVGSVTEATTGCMEILEDLTGSVSVTFEPGDTNVVDVTVIDHDDGSYTIDLYEGSWLCEIAGDQLDCLLFYETGGSLVWVRGNCTPEV